MQITCKKKISLLKKNIVYIFYPNYIPLNYTDIFIHKYNIYINICILATSYESQMIDYETVINLYYIVYIKYKYTHMNFFF